MKLSNFIIVKYFKLKWIALYVCVLAAIYGLMSAHGPSKKPRWGRALTIGNFLNVHESSIPWLEIDGKKYLHVIGMGPYYLTFSGGNAYFFVTAEDSMVSHVAHFAFVKDGKCYDVFTREHSLGNGVGMPDGSFYADSIEDYHWPIVLVKSRDSDLYEFNLIEGTCKKTPKMAKQGHP